MSSPEPSVVRLRPSPLVRAQSLLAWPLAVVGPLVVWRVGVGFLADQAPDVVIDAGCTEPWRPCAAPMPDVLADVAALGQVPALLIGGRVGLALVQAVAVRHRLAAAGLMVAAEALLIALVGVTVLQVGHDLA